MGFNKNGLLMIPIPRNDKIKMNTVKTRLLQVAGVQKISLCLEAPASEARSFTECRYDNRVKPENFEVSLKYADDQYIPAFGLKLAAGRNLFPSDTMRECLVNETLVKKLGLTPNEVIGRSMKFNDGKIALPIAGVLKDFFQRFFPGEHIRGMHLAESPAVQELRRKDEPWRYAAGNGFL